MADKVKPKMVTASWWRVLLINLAFGWHLTRPKWSAFAWKASRFLATVSVHMALAAYCAGIVMHKRIMGEYEDPPVQEYYADGGDGVN